MLVRHSITFGSLFLAALFGVPVRAETIAFTDVTVLPMDRDVALPHQTVIIDDDRISAVGPTRGTRIPRGARRIAGRGRFLMPGLGDMHVHFLRPRTPGRSDEQFMFADYQHWNEVYGLLEVANGVTNVRVMWRHPATDALAERFKTGEMVGPTIYSTGPVTDGDPPLWRGARVVTSVEEAQAAVREDKADGRIAIKVYDRLSPALYQAIVDEAHRVDLPVYGHIPIAVSLDQVIAARQNSIEHIDSFVSRLQPDPVRAKAMTFMQRYAAADSELLVPYAARLKDAGIWVCPTLVLDQMELPAGTAVEGMENFPPEFVARYGQNYSAATFANYQTELRFGLGVVKVLHDAGVGLLPGTDAFKVNAPPGYALLTELGLFVQAGLTPYEALRSATYDSARFLHRETEFGSVGVGRRADLLLLDADPRADLGALRKREGVMVRGRWYPQPVLDARVAKSRRS